MARRMLIDATHPEETRVVVLNGNRLEEFDFETSTKKQIKGNIYLAKVTRVEPSLQAAFVDYGGNRHGFLAFSEIHPDYYQIPVSDREALLAAERDDQHDHDAAEEPAPQTSHYVDHSQDDRQPDSAATGEGLAPSEYGAPSFQNGDSGTESGGDYAPQELGESYVADAGNGSSGEGGGSSDGGFIEMPASAATIETVGGDELEEARPRQRVHHRHYKIQEVIQRRQILLVQVTKEERGNKGAALTTYLSLAGRYCVLMPNAGRGGGVSRKITSLADRRRLKELMEDLDIPDGMGVIVRTAGSERSKAEIHRDLEYLLRLWDDIREMTLRSSAAALIHEEGDLIKRAIRDLYARDMEEILVEGAEGHRTAKDFMRMLMPSHATRVKPYRDPTIPLFHRFQIDAQIDQIHSPTVQLRSGGYVVINPTEALVAIDVNSGRSTRERNIEETATKTNLEAADEIARQLRLRDLAGLIVIDFIDMEDARNRGAVERRLKEAMKNDRARIQLGRISPFGLLELSRQRLRSSLIEASTEICPHCNGTGTIRSTESTALVVLRALEEEGIRRRTAEVALFVPTPIALYVLNQKRDTLVRIEQRYGFRVLVQQDDSLIPPAFRLDRVRAFTPAEIAALPAPEEVAPLPPNLEDEAAERAEFEIEAPPAEDRVALPAPAAGETEEQRGKRRRRRRRRRRSGEGEGPGDLATGSQSEEADGDDSEEDDSQEEPSSRPAAVGTEAGDAGAGAPGDQPRRKRRSRRGGGRRRRGETGAVTGSPESGVEDDLDTGSGFGPVENFANDGREYLLADPADEFGGFASASSDAPVTMSSVQEEPAAAEAPSGRRRSRRGKSAAAGQPEQEGMAPVEASAESEEAPKPRRGRRKPAAEAEAAAPEPEAVIEPVVAEDAPLDLAGELEPLPEPKPLPEPEPAIAGNGDMPAEAPRSGPSRSGWWRRLVQ